jgi:hypothetical protein
MGMSAQSSKLVPKLKAAGFIEHSIFALCFMNGGDGMTLGGVDTLQHTNSIAYTPLGRPTGWFTVTLLDITVGRSIGEPSSKYNSGKGIIVDSGTTDTYLPRSVQGALIKALASARLQYSTARICIPATASLRCRLLRSILPMGRS